MKKLISDMMMWANVTEEELQCRKNIPTAFGETLSWEYLCYVREHPIAWNVPTYILYGDRDNLTSYETISGFADQLGATLTVMKGWNIGFTRTIRWHSLINGSKNISNQIQ